MLASMRKLVYKMGFRPKSGTVLFSPSLALKHSFLDVWENADQTKMIVITEDTKIELVRKK